MAIRWDPLLVRALSRELTVALGGAKVSGLLMDPASRRVLLYTTAGTLASELHPNEGWISVLPSVDPLPGSRPLSARVGGVRALDDESAFVIDLPRAKRQKEDLELVVELIGNRWNAVLMERGSRAIREVLVPRTRGRRPLESGMAYAPPTATGRREPTTREEWAALSAASSAGASSEDGTSGSDAAETGRDALERRLSRQVAGTSSMNVGALTGSDGWERWRAMQDPESWTGFVVDTPGGPQPYPVQPGHLEAEAQPSLLEAFRVARERAGGRAPREALLLPSDLVSRLDKRVHRLRGRVKGLTRELEATADPEGLRSLGDLILARYADVPRGADRAVLEGFDGAPREVELDPALAARENAERYYAEASRVERARRILPERIEGARAEEERWTRLLEDVVGGHVSPDELARRLGTGGDREGIEGDALVATRKGSRTTGQPRSLPYDRFRSSSGLEIRVGRSAAHNDELTLHHSSPRDIWLHARQSPGAHVVLRWDRKGEPPRRDLIEAATLAALRSDARHAGTVAVDWTRRKYVRKPRKAPPGTVSLERAQTVFVAPNEELLERMTVRDDRR